MIISYTMIIIIPVYDEDKNEYALGPEDSEV